MLTLELDERAKRICDIVAAVTIAALAIKLESRGQILYADVRFRHENRAVRPTKYRVAAGAKDNGIYPMTRVGRILAQSGIVELPQFINVLRGEMSILGRQDICRWPAPALWWEREND